MLWLFAIEFTINPAHKAKTVCACPPAAGLMYVGCAEPALRTADDQVGRHERVFWVHNLLEGTTGVTVTAPWIACDEIVSGHEGEAAKVETIGKFAAAGVETLVASCGDS